jgi:serine/threonine protein phosphatase PrpC
MSKARPNEASEAQVIQWSGLSDVGRFRKNNQDAFSHWRLTGRACAA